MSERQFHLNAFLMGVGHHEAAWRHPRTNAANLLDVKHFQELGRIAERGKLDSVFFADGLAVGPRVKYNTQAIFEPVTLLSAIAAATDKVGLIATASTSYSDPYTLARKSRPSITSAGDVAGGTSSRRPALMRPRTSASMQYRRTVVGTSGPRSFST